MKHNKEYCLQEIEYWIRYLELMEYHMEVGLKYSQAHMLRPLAYIQCYQFRLKQLEAMS
jgi:hypothetical protein